MKIDYMDLLLQRFPPLRDQSTGAVYAQWHLMREFCGSDVAVADALRIVPAGLEEFSDFWTLLRLVHVHPPPAPLTLDEARRALAFQRPRGRAMADPELAPGEFWSEVLGRPARRFAPQARGEDTDPRIAALAVRAHGEGAGTTCVGLCGGQYLVAHAPERPPATLNWAGTWATLGLPPGSVRTIARADLALAPETNAMGAEGMVLRHLWLGFLERRGAGERAVTQAELYVFRDWLRRELRHAVVGNGPAGVDPITQDPLAVAA
jgi:hypothetical protein